jgi:hypothetical protein
VSDPTDTPDDPAAPFRTAGLDVVRAVLAPGADGADAPDPPTLLDRCSTLVDGGLRARRRGPDVADDGWTPLPSSTHPPAFHVERIDGRRATRVTLRYPPRDRAGGRRRADARALAFALSETDLLDARVVESASGALLAVDPDGLADVRARYGDRLVVGGRRLLAPEPLAAAALAGYDPDGAREDGTDGAPTDVFRVEAHPKGWALAHQPEVSRAREREQPSRRA